MFDECEIPKLIYCFFASQITMEKITLQQHSLSKQMWERAKLLRKLNMFEECGTPIVCTNCENMRKIGYFVRRLVAFLLNPRGFAHDRSRHTQQPNKR